MPARICSAQPPQHRALNPTRRRSAPSAPARALPVRHHLPPAKPLQYELAQLVERAATKERESIGLDAQPSRSRPYSFSTSVRKRRHQRVHSSRRSGTVSRATPGRAWRTSAKFARRQWPRMPKAAGAQGPRPYCDHAIPWIRPPAGRPPACSRSLGRPGPPPPARAKTSSDRRSMTYAGTTTPPPQSSQRIDRQPRPRSPHCRPPRRPGREDRVMSRRRQPAGREALAPAPPRSSTATQASSSSAQRRLSAGHSRYLSAAVQHGGDLAASHGTPPIFFF